MGENPSRDIEIMLQSTYNPPLRGFFIEKIKWIVKSYMPALSRWKQTS